jgi:hypothetical protein
MTTKLAHILQQTAESYMNVHPGLVTKESGWEKWYTQWLLTLSDIRELLGVEPTTQSLEKLLLKGDQLYAQTPTTKLWSQFVADEMERIISKYVRGIQSQKGLEK